MKKEIEFNDTQEIKNIKMDIDKNKKKYGNNEKIINENNIYNFESDNSDENNESENEESYPC